MIERGMMPSNAQGQGINRIFLNACIFFGIGIGLLAGYFAGQGFMRSNRILAHIIFVSLFVGGGFLVAYWKLGKSKKDDN